VLPVRQAREDGFASEDDPVVGINHCGSADEVFEVLRRHIGTQLLGL